MPITVMVPRTKAAMMSANMANSPGMAHWGMPFAMPRGMHCGMPTSMQRMMHNRMLMHNRIHTGNFARNIQTFAQASMLQPMTFAQWKNLYDYRRESYIKQIKDKMDREMAKEDKATLAENSMPASRLILKQQSNTYGKKYYKEVRKPERKRRREARKIGAIKDHRVLNRPDSPDFGMDSLDFEDFEPAIKRKKLSARVLKELEELSAVDQ